MDMGEGVPRESSINEQANCRSDPSAETAYKRRHGLVSAPRSMNQVRAEGAMQDAWQQPSHSARGRSGAKRLGKSHRPGGELGGTRELGMLSGDYVA